MTRFYERFGVGFRGPARLDPYRSDAEVREVANRLRSGDWAFAEDVLRRRSDSWLVSELLAADDSPVPLSAFEAWSSSSGSALSLALLGRAQVRAAWQIRGSLVAKKVPESAWEGFFSGLEVAERTLMESVNRDPSSSEPWVGLMRTARGLQLGRDELRERFDNAHSRHPFRPDACAAMLQGVCDKWGGSHDEMFAFARWIDADSEPDSAARAQLYIAHFEFFVVTPGSGKLASDYFGRPDVAAELASATESFLRVIPRETAARHLELLNMALLALEPVDARTASLVREVVERVALRRTPLPWAYYGGDGGKLFSRTRKNKLAQCRRFRG
jgi:hypothetical protein